MSMYKVFFLFSLFLTPWTNAIGQFNELIQNRQVAYYIGEEESKYENLVKAYNTMLFAVCDADMDKSYDLWISLMKDIEKYAESIHYDLKGVKLWMNVFWDENGKIDYIFFYPKPNSKNLNYDVVKDMLNAFAHQYTKLSLPYKLKYSHYGSSSFPVFSRVANGN